MSWFCLDKFFTGNDGTNNFQKLIGVSFENVKSIPLSVRKLIFFSVWCSSGKVVKILPSFATQLLKEVYDPQELAFQCLFLPNFLQSLHTWAVSKSCKCAKTNSCLLRMAVTVVKSKATVTSNKLFQPFRSLFWVEYCMCVIIALFNARTRCSKIVTML